MTAGEGRLQFRNQGIRSIYAGAVTARLASAVTTDTPFVERLVHFWANHFAVSGEKLSVLALAGDHEFDAIRPHVLGSFEELLFAAVLHPAMLLFLDQAQSIGPNSPYAKRFAAKVPTQAHGIGVNENLAREIMELHTLGVRTGYSQADVIELAKALTGWTVAGYGSTRAAGQVSGPAGETTFVESLHEPGSRTILGKTYAEEGEQQGKEVLRDLVRHPATARHIATQLARHFIADDPPASAVARLQNAFISSGGALPTVYRALIDTPEAWAASQEKFRNPWDWTVAALRATQLANLGDADSGANLFRLMGQPVWRPGSPAGWDDNVESWAAPGALMSRVEVAGEIAARVGPGADTSDIARAALGGWLTHQTAQAIAGTNDRSMAVALLLASPEFLRR
jgi:uncharacterized protein (DUF1800 family)